MTCCHMWLLSHLSCRVAAGFHRVSFIAMKLPPLANLIFLRGETLRDAFSIGRFHFTLYQNLPHADVCRYVVRRGSLDCCFTFLGIDSYFRMRYQVKYRLHTFHMENYQCSVRFTVARNHSVSRPGTFHDPSSVCKTLRCAECRVDF